MSQQKALILEKKQGDKLVIGVRDIPVPQSHELLVEIHAAALNPIDWKVQKYGIIYTEYPAVLGIDAAGVVAAVGADVQNFVKGDKVLFEGFFANNKAAFQQYAVVPAEITAKLPSNVSFDEAASVPLAFATAGLGLYSKKQGGGARLTPPWTDEGKTKYQGKPFVVFGGATSVGQFVIQLAKISGFSPIIATASLHNASHLKSIGATHVVPRNADLKAEVSAITSAPIDIAYDAVGIKETQEAGWSLLSPRGQLVVVAEPQVKKEGADEDKEVVHVFGSVHIPGQRESGVELFGALTQWLEDGSIKPNRVEILPGGLAGIPAGLEKLEKDLVSGVKLVARPQDTA